MDHMGPTDETGPSFQQVTSVGGFAYGVINADIHVFANGEPLYLLANWQPEPNADADWLRQMPSRMLNARRAVVPFTGREQELADLRQWRDGGALQLSVRWLHGPGGQGKTRLAAQFAAESLAAGWKVIAAFHGPDADRPESGSQDMALAGTAGLLLLVDYADRWLLSNLTWLLKNALLHQVGVPTRVLMIARSLDAWPAISAILDNHRAHTSSQRLPDLPSDHGRSTMFTAARDRFAAIYRHPDPTVILSPPQLDSPEFGLTLAVHMAALVAVDATAHGERPPEGMDALTRYLLNREQLHWRRLYHDGITETGSGYQTPGHVMNQAVFTAALTGALDHTAGVALLEQLGLGPDVEQILKDHTVCYPPAEPPHPTVLEPLYPDRLTEDFLALTMPGHHTDYPEQVWAPNTATVLLTNQFKDNSTNPVLSRSVTFLAAATDRWPHIGNTYLYPLLRKYPDIAIRAGGTALNTLAISRSMTIELLETLEPLLPAGRHIDFDIAAAAISSALTPHRVAHATDPAEQARLHTAHASRLDNAGYREQALAPDQEATRIYRRLAEADPDAYLPALAVSLNNLATSLSGLGRREQALAAAEEGTGIYRRLAEANPDAYLPDRALSLTSLGNRLAEVGRREQALAAAGEAVAIRRRLAEANPDAYLPDLALSLNNLGNRLAEVGRREQALAAAEEAVAIRRQLAEANPHTYLPNLAASLTNMGIRLAEVGRREQALTAAAEGARIYRRLAEANPDAYLPDLATSLTSLGTRVAQVGRREQAPALAEEAVAIWRRLAQANPEAFLPDLAESLNNLSVCLAEVGRREEALAVAEEAVAIRRRLAEANPEAYLPGLAESLTNLSASLAEVGRREQALAAAEEAVAMQRRLADANPEAYLPDLAGPLTNLSASLAEVGRREEALAVAEEAVAIQRRLAEANPDAYLPNLAESLTSLSAYLAQMGRHERALAAAEEAAAMQRRLAQANPDAYLPNLAGSLNNLGNRLADTGRREEALATVEESVVVRRRLAESNPDAYLPSLALSLNNLGISLAETGRREQALATVEEAVVIRRRLAEANPDAYLPSLAASLRAHAWICVKVTANLPQALESVTEAIDLYQPLAQQIPQMFAMRLSSAYRTLAEVLDGLGRTEEAADVRRHLNELTEGRPTADLPPRTRIQPWAGRYLDAAVRVVRSALTVRHRGSDGHGE